ncbi:calmodulin-like protein 3 [Lichtheimia hyalospora FSU 10163]|nr:calmodulin-like protein 3 [Lichtheimia hyalospora FSU 10163]
MADQLSDDQREEIREIFNYFDTDQDGWIDAHKLGAAMKSMKNIQPTEAELQEMINEVDKDGNGKVDLNEFFAMFAALLKESSPTDEEWKQTFQAYDKDGDGFLTVDELRQFLEQLEGNLQPDDVESMVREADDDGDGKINYQEFAKMVRG